MPKVSTILHFQSEGYTYALLNKCPKLAPKLVNTIVRTINENAALWSGSIQHWGSVLSSAGTEQEGALLRVREHIFVQSPSQLNGATHIYDR